LHDHEPLRQLGWSDDFETEFAPYAAQGLLPARVAVEHRSAYALYSAAGELWGEVAGRLRHAGDRPAVGDWVAAMPREDGRATVHALLTRRTVFSRKTPWLEAKEQVVAANVDVVFVVTTLTDELSPRRLERYLTMAWESGAQPVIVLNKADLCPDARPLVAAVESVAIGVPVVLASALTGAGVDELRSLVRDGRTGALLGSSGVGKSTLVNRLVGWERQETAEIRADGKRGRHTTSRRELVFLPGGGVLLDTPGMRELQLWEASSGVERAFADVGELAARCRFADCAHETEPDCAVREALDSGALAWDRLESYRKLQRELERLDSRLDKRTRAEARKERRRFERSRRRTAW
jgi:ribosome biogenesis GTPase / thiamine phosphate phosphatase